MKRIKLNLFTLTTLLVPALTAGCVASSDGTLAFDAGAAQRPSVQVPLAYETLTPSETSALIGPASSAWKSPSWPEVDLWGTADGTLYRFEMTFTASQVPVTASLSLKYVTQTLGWQSLANAVRIRTSGSAYAVNPFTSDTQLSSLTPGEVLTYDLTPALTGLRTYVVTFDLITAVPNSNVINQITFDLSSARLNVTY